RWRRSAEVLVEALERLREVGAPEAHAQVTRLLVDAAGQQQHAGALGDLLTPALDIVLAGHAREAGRSGIRAHPLEQRAATLEKGVQEGQVGEHDPPAALDELVPVA